MVEDHDAFSRWRAASLRFDSGAAELYHESDLYRHYAAFAGRVDDAEVMIRRRFVNRWKANTRAVKARKSGVWFGFTLLGDIPPKPKRPRKPRISAPPAEPTPPPIPDFSILGALPDLKEMDDGARVTAWMRTRFVFGAYWYRWALRGGTEMPPQSDRIPRFTPEELFEDYCAVLAEQGLSPPASRASFYTLFGIRGQRLGLTKRVRNGQRVWTGLDYIDGHRRCGRLRHKPYNFTGWTAARVAEFWFDRHVIKSTDREYRPNHKTKYTDRESYAVYNQFCVLNGLPPQSIRIFIKGLERWVGKNAIDRGGYLPYETAKHTEFYNENINILSLYDPLVARDDVDFSDLI